MGGFAENFISGAESGLDTGIDLARQNRRDQALQRQRDIKNQEDLQKALLSFERISGLPKELRVPATESVFAQFELTTGTQLSQATRDAFTKGKDEDLFALARGLTLAAGGDPSLPISPEEIGRLGGAGAPELLIKLFEAGRKSINEEKAREVTQEGGEDTVEQLVDLATPEGRAQASSVLALKESKSKRARQLLTEPQLALAKEIFPNSDIENLTPKQFGILRREAEFQEVNQAGSLETAKTNAEINANQNRPIPISVVADLGLKPGVTPADLAKVGMVLPNAALRKEIRDKKSALNSIIRTSNRMLSILQTQGNKVLRVAGGTAIFLNEVVAQAQGFADLAGFTSKEFEFEINSDFAQGTFKDAGITSREVQGLIVNLTFAAAALSGQTGRAVIERDLIRFAKELGARSGSAIAFATVLQKFRERAVLNFQDFESLAFETTNTITEFDTTSPFRGGPKEELTTAEQAERKFRRNRRKGRK